MLLLLAAVGCSTTSQEPESAAPEPSPEAAPLKRAVADVAEVAPKPVVEACPKGVIAAPGWPGEYPEPVVHVTQEVQVYGWSHPCADEPAEQCRLAPGLYHPWVRDPQQIFVTVRAVEDYTASEAFQLGSHAMKPGAHVRLTQEIGEGFCAYEIDGETFQAECPALLKGRLKPEATAERDTTQFMRVPCTNLDGAQSWVAVDDALFEIDGVQKGVVVEYGKVGPASEP